MLNDQDLIDAYFAMLQARAAAEALGHFRQDVGDSVPTAEVAREQLTDCFEWH